MTLLIFFSIVIATIILAIVLQRIIHCPILVGFAFFAIFLVVAAVFNSITFVIAAIILGILAFLSAFLDCVFNRCGFFRNNDCLACDDNTGRSGRNCNCNCNNDETLTILNSNGQVLARINGNSVTCNSNNGNSCSNCCNNSCGNGNNSTFSAGSLYDTASLNNNIYTAPDFRSDNRSYRNRC